MIGFVFFILFIPLLIILGLAYFRTKKVYPLMYILSAFSFIISIAYFIGAWELKKDAIIATLGASAILLMAIGFHISHSKKQHDLKFIKRYGIVLPFAVIVFASIIGYLNIGIEMQTDTIYSVECGEIFSGEQKIHEPYGNTMASQVLLQTITIKNSFFLSAFVKIPKYTICFHPFNETCDIHSYLRYWEDNNSFYRDVVEISPRSEKTVEIRLPKVRNYLKEIRIDSEQASTENDFKNCNFSEILLIETNKEDRETSYGHVECSSLSKEQIENAVRIKIL